MEEQDYLAILLTKLSNRLLALFPLGLFGSLKWSHIICIFHLYCVYVFLFAVKNPVHCHTHCCLLEIIMTIMTIMATTCPFSMWPSMYCSQYRHNLTQEQEARPKLPAPHYNSRDKIFEIMIWVDGGNLNKVYFKAVVMVFTLSLGKQIKKRSKQSFVDIL